MERKIAGIAKVKIVNDDTTTEIVELKIAKLVVALYNCATYVGEFLANSQKLIPHSLDPPSFAPFIHFNFIFKYLYMVAPQIECLVYRGHVKNLQKYYLQKIS